MTQSRRIVLAVTGASGMPYALTLARALSATPGVELHCIVSDAARTVLEVETDAGPDAFSGLAARTYGQDDLAAPPASGSWRHDGMVVCPCSMASLAAVARGLGSNLVHRAADVCLKERRPLVLVPRETPLSRIHLENMLAAHAAGAHIAPACPGFYHRPQTVQDLCDHLAARVLDLLAIPHDLCPRWGQ
ncbi:MAG: UbiX family flavin prenyltransferase [Thermodesulfobacteriota bacterium]